jgi:hypothetical protein
VDKPNQVKVHNINNGMNCTFEFSSKGVDVQKIMVDNLTTKGD